VTAIRIQLGTLPFGVSRPEREPNPRRAAPRMIRRSEPTGHIEMQRDLHNRTDEALLDAYVHGERSALRELIERYRDELFHFLTRFLGSRAAAEDVFQETFLQVHLSADTFDTSRRLKPWLFTIAANKARDYHRKHGRRTPVSLSSSIGEEGQSQRYVDLMEADLPTPDAPLLDAERSRLVKAAIDSMPAHLREILLLSYFQRLSYNQIAETLEIPLGTVKSRLHTAVATFARAWTAARVENEPEDG
jgi:RNA polymerase sigma-70 factor (ECF subfamily)